MTAQSRNIPTKLSPIKVDHKQTDLFVIQSLGVSSRLVKTRALAFACSAVFLAGCASTSPSAQHTPDISPAVRSLRWLDTADPQSDLSSALARGDRRFIGVGGYTVVTPGVEHSLASRYGIRYLAGTTDSILGSEHARLQHLAMSYAERYNKLLFERLKQ